MTSEFVTDVVGSDLPLNEVRRVQPQDSQRWLLVRLKAHAACRPGMGPQTLDGVWQPLVKG